MICSVNPLTAVQRPLQPNITSDHSVDASVSEKGKRQGAPGVSRETERSEARHAPLGPSFLQRAQE